jgi:hypothetical protein
MADSFSKKENFKKKQQKLKKRLYVVKSVRKTMIKVKALMKCLCM